MRQKPHIQTTKTIYWLFGDDINVTLNWGMSSVVNEKMNMCVYAFDATECIFMSARQQHRGGCYAFFFLFLLCLFVVVVVLPNISGTFSTSLFIKRHIRGWHCKHTMKILCEYIILSREIWILTNNPRLLEILKKYRWNSAACIETRFAIKFSILPLFFSMKC